MIRQSVESDYLSVSVNRLLVSELALKPSRHCQVEQVTKTSLADTHRFQVSACDEVVHHNRSVRSVRLLRNYSYEWLRTQFNVKADKVSVEPSDQRPCVLIS